jgi:hypothetical protein
VGGEGREREDLVRAREEISGLRRRLAEERFAEELKDALTLAASAGEISSPISHSRLLEMIVQTAASVIPSRAASLFLIDEEAEELVFEVALGSKAEEVRKFRIPLGHGIAGARGRKRPADGDLRRQERPSPGRRHSAERRLRA